MDRLPKTPANYVPLTPLTFLKRASMVYSNRTSVIYAGVSFTWRQTYERCCRLAYSLRSLNVVKNDVVSVLAPNIPALYEMHFAVPMAGAVLNAINTRLDAKNIATILRHSEAKVFFVDYQYVPLASEALRLLMASSIDVSSTEYNMPLVIVIDDVDTPTGVRLGRLEYEQLVLHGNPQYPGEELEDEWDAIALNYTSGTTSDPKGVVYSHRGAFLSTMSLIQGWELGTEAVYLWSLPMFHCNGWTFTWGVAARGGTNVCIRNTTAKEMYKSISQHKVTHMCCAPIVFNIILEAKSHERCEITKKVNILTGGAPPPAALLEKMEGLGFHITHAYGLTEATGPALVCEWQTKWNTLSKDLQARLKARQGVGILTLADVDVKIKKTMESVPHDGTTMGEIVLRGSSIMKGYLKDEKETAKAFHKGWFFTGDVGVIHPDGYLEIKDRSKDVIISGGENISSVELESILFKHPNILEAAVVAMPHPRWGESPCAFVVLKNAGTTTEAEILAYCRQKMSKFMVPKKVEFVTELPKNGTNKVLKGELREIAKTLKISENKPTNNKRSEPRYQHDELHDQDKILAMSRIIAVFIKQLQKMGGEQEQWVLMVTARTPTNIAVIKYWGKRDETLILPINDSISVTLDPSHLCTTTTVSVSPTFHQDRMWLNGKEISLQGGRFQSCLREIRARAQDVEDKKKGVCIKKEDWQKLHLHIASYNNFPTAAGLASSAAGLACLVYSLAKLMNLKEDNSQLSAIARQGSGSACRSLYGGFVKWDMGKEDNGSDSLAIQLADEKHWDELVIIIAVVSARQKETSSTSGMRDTVETSALIQHRAKEVVPKRIVQMEEAIQKRDFPSFARLACTDSNQFHAVCLDTYPPIFYMNDTSHRIISCVEKWNRAEGTPQVAYTFDAGPNAVMIARNRKTAALLLQRLLYNFPPQSDTNLDSYIIGDKSILKDAGIKDMKDVEALTPPPEVKDNIPAQKSKGDVSYFICTRPGGGPVVLSDETQALLDPLTGLPK